jgi:hypothetical protein
MHYNKSMMAKQCTTFAGHFNGHANAAMQYCAHHPMEEVNG